MPDLWFHSRGGQGQGVRLVFSTLAQWKKVHKTHHRLVYFFKMQSIICKESLHLWETWNRSEISYAPCQAGVSAALVNGLCLVYVSSTGESLAWRQRVARWPAVASIAFPDADSPRFVGLLLSTLLRYSWQIRHCKCPWWCCHMCIHGIPPSS